MKSIRFKITAITVAAILTSIFSVFAASYTTIRQENDRRSVEVMTLQLQNTQKTLNRYFESVEKSVEMTASIASDQLDSVILIENNAAGKSALLSERSAEMEARLDEYLRGYCDFVQQVFSGVAGRTYGVVAYYFCINPYVSKNMLGFYYAKAGKTGFDAKEPIDVTALDPKDELHDAWYFTAVQRGNPSWIGPYADRYLNDREIISYIVPVYQSGTLIGVLGMDIPLDTLIEQLSSIRLYKTGYACLLDENGKVIYHPEAPIGTEAGFLNSLSGENITEMEESGDQVLRFSENGRMMQVSFCTLESGHKLLIVVPTSEINTYWTRFARIILLITAAVILFYAVVVSVIVNLLMKPLQELTVASKQLAAGDYDTKLDYKGKDEIGELTQAFSQMRDQLKLNIEDLNRRIYTDRLTGLPNMRHFFNLADAENRRMSEEGRSAAILYFNLIGIKYFNRQYGFEAGDNLIKKTGEIIAAHFGHSCIGRMGQDHFAAIADESGLEDTLGEIFRDCSEANQGISLPIRVGIYPMRLEPVGLDVACDRAKYACDRYRSRYESGYYYFNRIMLKQAENDRYIISHLDQALREKWIKVYYQPIIRTETGKVTDEEALSRWIDPEKGFLSPAEFIPVLEGSRLIYKLDLYVVDQVIEKLKSQNAPGFKVIPQSINLSRSDFDACDIVEEIRKRADRAGIRHDLISIEITESIIGRDFEFMKGEMDRFRSLGFQVWMDDFGSGYSSLDVLQSLQFDLIKFDMSFMRQLDQNPRSRVILKELMHLAHQLGADTLCEGVETEAHVQFLREVGCGRLQGFYFSKPLSMEEIAERYRSGNSIELESFEEARAFAEMLHKQSLVSEEKENV